MHENRWENAVFQSTDWSNQPVPTKSKMESSCCLEPRKCAMKHSMNESKPLGGWSLLRQTSLTCKRRQRQWQRQWHSKKSIQQQSVAWPYKREWRGHDHHEKVCWSWWDLRCWQGVHLHTVDDSVQLHQTQNHERMSQTQAVAGINSLNSESLESSDSVQQNERGPREPKKQQEEKCAMHHCSSVRPKRFPTLLSRDR